MNGTVNPMEVYFATSNKHKFAEACHILDMKLRRIDIDLEEIQEVSVRKVAIHKANIAYRKLRKPVIVEDTGLHLKGLNGFPGALVKWLISNTGTGGVCRIADRLKNREAYAETCVAFHDGRKVRAFTGRIYGTIAKNPSGKTGFGWDAIFIPKGYAETFAQMDMKRKSSISMRGIAFRKLKKAMFQ